MSRRSRQNSARPRAALLVLAGAIVVAIVLVLSSAGQGGHQGTTQTGSASKPVILYVNQGNGVVNSSNFGRLLSVAASHGFNTIFFQVYRSGVLLFDGGSLVVFATLSHGQGMRIYFALYFTNSSQRIPASIYNDGEDGINLDMSTLPTSAQERLLSNLSLAYSGSTAVTTTDFSTTLKPDLLILETYGPGLDQYIHSGVIASVGVFTTSGKQEYDQEVLYALDNSDGVMVFDYSGLVKAGY